MSKSNNGYNNDYNNHDDNIEHFSGAIAMSPTTKAKSPTSSKSPKTKTKTGKKRKHTNMNNNGTAEVQKGGKVTKTTTTKHTSKRTKKTKGSTVLDKLTDTGNANYGNSAIDMSVILQRLTRSERLGREKTCARYKDAHGGQEYVPRESKYKVWGDKEGDDYEDCDPIEQVVPSHKTMDKLGILYKGIHNKYVCQHPNIGGIWHADHIDRENGIDACLVRKEDADCISGRHNGSMCTRIANYPDIFGRLAGRMVSRDKEMLIRQKLKGRLPNEWPLSYNNAKLPINSAVKLFFNDKMSTPPMNANGPYEGPVTKEAKLKSCAARDNEDLRAMRAGKHQAVIYTVMQALARPNMTGSAPRGILAWHSTGSGKTAVAAGVAEAFWNVRCPSDPSKLRPIIFLCSVAGIRSNPPENFAKEARRFFKPEWKEKWLHAKENGGNLKCVEQQQAYEMGVFLDGTTNARSDENRMFLMTFKEFANRLDLVNRYGMAQRDKLANADPNFAKDAILIIDEVHNLFKPLAGQGVDNAAVRKWLLSRDLKEEQGDMKVVIMTATPGDTIPQMQALLQVIQNQDLPPITVPPPHKIDKFVEFGKSIRGLVSFLDLSHDASKFPRIDMEQSKPIMCTMSKEQTKKYLQEYEDFSKKLHGLKIWVYNKLKHDPEAKNHMRIFRDVVDFAEKVVTSGNGEAQDDSEDDKKKKRADVDDGIDGDIDSQASGWFNKKKNDLVRELLTSYSRVRKTSVWAPLTAVKFPMTRDLKLLEAISPKSAKFIEILQKSPNAKHYAYCEFNQTAHGAGGKLAPGIQFLARTMEPYGYTRIWHDDLHQILAMLGLSVEKEKAIGKSKLKNPINCDELEEDEEEKPKVPKVEDETEARRIIDKYFQTRGINTTNAKFCVCLCSSAFKFNPGKSGVEPETKLPGDLKGLEAKMVQALYNSKANAHGKLLNVILASGNYNESIDLQGVQYLHFLSPFMSQAAEAQAIGRARRNCSHTSLGFNADWKVTIYRYMSVLPEGATYGKATKSKAPVQGTSTKTVDFNYYPRGSDTIDQIIDVARRRAHNQLEILSEIIKRRAVDCALFSRFHKGVKCNKIDDVISDMKLLEKQNEARIQQQQQQTKENKENKDKIAAANNNRAKKNEAAIRAAQLKNEIKELMAKRATLAKVHARERELIPLLRMNALRRNSNNVANARHVDTTIPISSRPNRPNRPISTIPKRKPPQFLGHSASLTGRGESGVSKMRVIPRPAQVVPMTRPSKPSSIAEKIRGAFRRA